MKPFRILAVALLFISLAGYGQQVPDSSAAAGSKPFKTGSSRNFWMGANYRAEWNTALKAPVISLAAEHGGLKPVKKGGGKQTKSLKLEDPAGRGYSLRSIQKFVTSKTLPGDLQSEAAADLVSDGISASYPYSALSVKTLNEAASIPHGDVKLVYIPDDPLLGEFRGDFANMLALYEERLPDSVNKDWDTDEVADKLKDDNDNRVDQQALLKIRVLDMFVMDLDRHEDQWTWGAYDNGKGKTFFPIAKDRDQAFYTNQGLLPGIVKWPWLVPQLQGFRAKARNIRRFNYAARNLDRFFLNELNEDDWKKVTADFLATMTDSVIEAAIDQQPPEIRGFSGEKIKTALKERRNYLAAETDDYYRFLSEIVSITGSDKKELFQVSRDDDGSVTVHVYKINKEGEQSTLMYNRKFNPSVTKEIRLYGFDGDDQFEVTGSNDKIRIRMIGGDGKDKFENTGSSRGGIVYDNRGKDNTLTGHFRDKRSNDSLVNSFQRIYYKYDQVIPLLTLGYNQDDGVFIGASLRFVKQGFRKSPYKSMNSFAVSHALSTKAFDFRWYAEHIGVFGSTGDLLTDVDINAPNNTTNFFGYGMGTQYIKSNPGKFRYYRARYSLGDISILLRKRFSKAVTLTVGPTYEFYRFDTDDELNQSRYISQTGVNGLDPATLFSHQDYLGGKLAVEVDTRDNPMLTMKGVHWTTQVRHLEGMTDAAYKHLTQLNTDFSFSVQLVPKKLSIAERFGGGHNFGSFEFYQAQYLGNDADLRGFRKYRFAGRTKFYNNIEARLALAKFQTYLFPGSLGILGFFDTGRVWVKDDAVNSWASGYGGGVWISPLNRILLTVSYAASKEDRMILLSLGWRF